MTFILLIFWQTELLEPQKVYDFAEYLHAYGDYAAALQEYNRYKFLGNSIEIDIEPKILDCLIRLKRFDDAMHNAREYKNASYWQGIILYHAAKYDSARYYLLRSDPDNKARANYFIGLSHAAQFDFNNMQNYIEFNKPLPSLKKPWLGGLLSIIPGAGHIYANRWGDSIFSFLTVALFGTVSYYYSQTDEDLKLGIALSATAIFYAGNIYGGINAARNYNYYKNSQYLDEIHTVYNEYGY